jgi:hypothetical protein
MNNQKINVVNLYLSLLVLPTVVLISSLLIGHDLEFAFSAAFGFFLIITAGIGAYCLVKPPHRVPTEGYRHFCFAFTAIVFLSLINHFFNMTVRDNIADRDILGTLFLALSMVWGVYFCSKPSCKSLFKKICIILSAALVGFSSMALIMGFLDIFVYVLLVITGIWIMYFFWTRIVPALFRHK